MDNRAMAGINKNSQGMQLFLPVQIKPENKFEHYLGEANTHAVESIKRFIEDKSETLLFLVGAEAVGKTHLLSAAVHYCADLSDNSAQYSHAGYFSCADLCGEALSLQAQLDLQEFLEGYDFLALDDLDQWLDALNSAEAEETVWAERLLFRLFNHFKEHNKQLMIAAKTVPSRLTVQLKDLQSRLASGLLVSLVKLNDQEKDQLLRALANIRGFQLDDEVSAYILRRSGRDLPNLVEILEQLDQASLSEQRKLTVPFVKKVLNW